MKRKLALAMSVLMGASSFGGAGLTAFAAAPLENPSSEGSAVIDDSAGGELLLDGSYKPGPDWEEAYALSDEKGDVFESGVDFDVVEEPEKVEFAETGQENYGEGAPEIRPLAEGEEITDDKVLTEVVTLGNAFSVRLKIDGGEDNIYDGRYLVLYYSKDGEDYKQLLDYSGYIRNNSAVVTAKDLDANSTYHYYLVIADKLYNMEDEDILWSAKDKPQTIEVGEDRAVTAEEIPDATLFSAVKKAAGLGLLGKDFNISSLLGIKTLSLSCDPDVSVPISDLKGVSLLKNLESLYLPGHNIEGLNELVGMTSLRSISLSYNNVKEVPDLTSCTSLKSLDLQGNLLTQEAINSVKLPEGAEFNSIEQRGEVTPILAKDNTYYAVGNKHPFIVDFKHLKSGYRKYEATLTVNGTETGLTSQTASDLFICEDVPGVKAGDTVKGALKLVDHTGEVCYEGEIDITFEADVPDKRDVYATVHDVKVNSEANLPGEYTKEDVTGRVVDANGNEVAAAVTVSYAHTSTGERRYEGIFQDYALRTLGAKNTSVSYSISLYKALALGDYKVVMTAGGREMDAATLKITDKPVVYEVAESDKYDCGGDYFYIETSGVNLTEGIKPELTFSGTKAATFTGDVFSDGGSLIYKMKKENKDTLWGENTETFTVSFAGTNAVTQSDESVEYRGSYQNRILFGHYNYKKQFDETTKGYYELFTRESAAVPDGTEVTGFVMKDSWDNISEENALAKGTGIVTGGVAKIRFTDLVTKEPYDFTSDSSYNVKYFTFSDKPGSHYHYAGRNRYNDYSSSESKAYLGSYGVLAAGDKSYKATVNVRTSLLSEADAVKAKFAGKEFELTKGKANGDFTAFEGEWTADEGIAEGEYTLSVTQNGAEILKTTVYAVGDTFQLTSIGGSFASETSVGVYIYSPHIYYDYAQNYSSKNKRDNADAKKIWEDRKFTITFRDGAGEEIAAGSPTSITWNNERSLNATYTIPAGYTGVYALVKMDQKDAKDAEEGKASSEWKNFFDRSSHYYSEKGYYIGRDRTLGANIVGDNSYKALQLEGDIDFPVKAVFESPYAGVALRSLTIKASDLKGNRWYYLTKSDLAGMTTEDVYKVSLIDKSGFSGDEVAYFSVSNNASDEKAPLKGIRIDGAAARTMEVGSKEKLTITLNPSNAEIKGSPTWKSANEKVVTMGEDGTVTAVATGEAKVTATLDGKSASVTITVIDKLVPITAIAWNEATNARFDKSAAIFYTGDTFTLGVTTNDGANERMVYEVSDTKVATVDSTGTLRAVGGGTAEIVAKSASGKVQTGKLTVTVIASPSDLDNMNSISAGDVMPAVQDGTPIWVAGLDKSYSYTGSKITPAVRVYYGDTLLREKVEYTLSYKNNAKVGKASIIVKGKGNFSGSDKETAFKIVKGRLDDGQTAAAVNSKGKTEVYHAGVLLKEKRDYTVNGSTVTGAGNYEGTYTIPEDGTQASLTKAVVEIPATVAFTGTPIELAPTKVLAAMGGAEVPADAYTLSYTANMYPGTATVTVSGVPEKGYVGSVTKKFKILPFDLSSKSDSVGSMAVSAEIPEKVPYEKGGSRPVPVLRFTNGSSIGWTLREGVDYKVTYKNNTKVGAQATAVVKGMGNFKGQLPALTFTVEKGDLSSLAAFAADKKANDKKKGAYLQSVPTVYDQNGKTLANKKDFKIVSYTSGGTELTKDTMLSDGMEVTVALKGEGSYEGELEVTYRVRANAIDLKTAKAKIAPVEYTGEEIEPTVSEVTVKNQAIALGDGFEVIGYFNNVGKGTASMLIAGTGDCSGSKLLKFKINAHKMSIYHGEN